MLTYNTRGEKIKDGVATREAYFFFPPARLLQLWKGTKLKHDPTRLFYIKLKIIAHYFQKGEKNKSERANTVACEIFLVTSFIYLFFVVACLCRSSKKPPTFPTTTTQGETSLKLAPIYGVRSCQREIPLSLKKAHWICVSSIILKPLALKQKQQRLLFGFHFTECLHVLPF